jgi:hypothetical protein
MENRLFSSSRGRRRQQSTADQRAALRSGLEDRFARGEQIEIHGRAIEISPRAGLLGVMVPSVLPLLGALGAALGGVGLITLAPSIQNARQPLVLAAAVGGFVLGMKLAGVCGRAYGRSLAGRPRPSALLSSTAIELHLPGLEHVSYELAQISGLSFLGGEGASRYAQQARGALLGGDGQTLIVLPISLVLADGDFQLGEYLVAAAPGRFALEFVKSRNILLGTGALAGLRPADAGAVSGHLA